MPLYLEDLLKPFEYLDISAVYDRYSQIIDFTIAFLIFLGITKVILSRRFEGRGGEAVIIGVSLALTIGFMAMENALGFSMRSFGGIGGSILIIIVGLVLFSVFRSLGFKFGNAISISYVIIYLSMRAVVPGVFDFIADTAPFINGILGLIFLFCLGKLLYGLYHRIRGPGEFSPETLLGNERDNLLKDGIETNREGEILLKGKLSKISKRDLKSSDAIIDQLQGIKMALTEYGNTRKGRMEIAEILNKLSKSENHYLADIQKLHKLMKKLESYDEKELNNLKARLEKVSEKEKPFIEREIEITEKKIEVEEKLSKYNHEIYVLTDKFNSFLRTAIHIIDAGNYPQDALRYIDDCIKIETYIKKMLREIKIAEAELASFAENATKTFKKEQKELG